MARRTPASGNDPGRCQPTGGDAADAFFSNAAGLQAVGFGGEPVGDAKRWFASSVTGVEVRMGGAPAHSIQPHTGWHSTANQQHSTQQHVPHPQTVVHAHTQLYPALPLPHPASVAASPTLPSYTPPFAMAQQPFAGPGVMQQPHTAGYAPSLAPSAGYMGGGGGGGGYGVGYGVGTGQQPAMATGCGGFVSATGAMALGQQDAACQRPPVGATLSVAPAVPHTTTPSAVTITEGATDEELQFNRDKIFLQMEKVGGLRPSQEEELRAVLQRDEERAKRGELTAAAAAAAGLHSFNDAHTVPSAGGGAALFPMPMLHPSASACSPGAVPCAQSPASAGSCRGTHTSYGPVASPYGAAVGPVHINPAAAAYPAVSPPARSAAHGGSPQNPSVCSGNMSGGSAKPKRADDDAVRTFASVAEKSQPAHTAAAAAGVPLGPLPVDAEQLKRELKRLSADVSQQGGGFTISGNGGYVGTAKRGPVQKFKCTAPGCPWRVEYEKSTGGWALVNAHADYHNHPLETQQTAVCATSAGRQIPFEYDELGRLLMHSGVPCATTERVLRTKAGFDNKEVTWLYEDVYERYYRNSGQFDAKGLVNMLDKRKAETGLEYCLDVNDDDNSIARVFVELPYGQECWGTSRNAERVAHSSTFLRDRVLFIDPTCNTNKFGLKLTMFITIDFDGHTRVLGYLVHWSESEKDIFWGLRAFDNVFDTPPTVVFTDSAAGLLGAVDAFQGTGMPWEGEHVKHLLCTFHLDINFQVNVRPLFKSDPAKWQCAHNMFWRLAKDADVSHPEALNRPLQGAGVSGNASSWVPSDDCTALRAYVSEHGSGASKEKTLKWMDDVLIARASMWVATSTWRNFTGGAHSTARAESNQSAFKRMSKQKSSLVQLDQQLLSFDAQTDFKSAVAYERKLLKAQRSVTVLPAFLTAVRPLISPYAFDLVSAQFSQSVAYTSTPMKGEGVWRSAMCAETGRVLDQWNNTVWSVARQDGAQDVRATTKSDGQRCYECAFDTGSADARTARATTYWHCSCQYQCSYGVPCRHMLHLWLTHPLPNVTEFYKLFNMRWFMCSADALYDVARNANQLRQSAPAASSSADVQPPPSATPSPCYTALVGAMDKHSYVPAVNMFTTGCDDNDFDLAPYIGATIVHKYGSVNWYLAKVSRAPADAHGSHNVQLHYHLTDKNVANAFIGASNQVNFFNSRDQQAVQPRGAWMPVKMRELRPSAAAAAAVTDPAYSPALGRPQQRRLQSSNPHNPTGRDATHRKRKMGR